MHIQFSKKKHVLRSSIWSGSGRFAFINVESNENLRQRSRNKLHRWLNIQSKGIRLCFTNLGTGWIFFLFWPPTVYFFPKGLAMQFLFIFTSLFLFIYFTYFQQAFNFDAVLGKIIFQSQNKAFITLQNITYLSLTKLASASLYCSLQGKTDSIRRAGGLRAYCLSSNTTEWPVMLNM